MPALAKTLKAKLRKLQRQLREAKTMEMEARADREALLSRRKRRTA